MKLIEFVSKKKISIKKRLLAVLVIAVTVTLSTLLLGFVIPKEITLVDGDREIVVTTGRMFVDEVLAEQGIILRQGDRVSMPLNETVANNDRIVIERGKEIILTADGKTESIYSCEPVLKQALADCGIVMNQYDEITPVLETPVTEGMAVQIFRVEVLEETVSKAIERSEIIRPNFEQPASYQAVVDEGWDGAYSVKYRVVTRDGQEIIREEKERTLLWEPGARILERGIQGGKVVVASTAELQVKEELICNATAYDASPASNGIYAGKTATGRTPAYGVVAVDPSVIPLGSKLYIEAADGSWVYGYAVAGDTGGAIRGNKVDLFYNTTEECRAFGRRQARVYVLE